MSHLEKVEASRWQEFVGAPMAVLVLGKSDCDACAAWSSELEQYLEDHAPEWTNVRFGKIFLNEPGLTDFKRSNPWLASLDSLPFTQIYVDGERSKSFFGGGIERLLNRLRSLSP